MMLLIYLPPHPSCIKPKIPTQSEYVIKISKILNNFTDIKLCYRYFKQFLNRVASGMSKNIIGGV